jgi:hypothetical protein
MFTTTRTLKAAMLVAALLFSVMLLNHVSAEKEISSKSMEWNASDQRDKCFGDGGRTFGEHYNYDDAGNVTSITTNCYGGHQDGRHCIDTPGYVDCWQDFVAPTPSTHQQPGGGVIDPPTPTPSTHGTTNGTVQTNPMSGDSGA